MNERKTKQKECILEVIEESYDHPTIKEIINKVKIKEPNIGQATIYRNVNKLVSEGKMIRLPSIREDVHYDAKRKPHNHFICRKCHNIIDIHDNDYPEISKEVESKYSLKVENMTILYEGICEECNGKI